MVDSDIIHVLLIFAASKKREHLDANAQTGYTD